MFSYKKPLNFLLPDRCLTASMWFVCQSVSCHTLFFFIFFYLKNSTYFGYLTAVWLHLWLFLSVSKLLCFITHFKMFSYKNPLSFLLPDRCLTASMRSVRSLEKNCFSCLNSRSAISFTSDLREKKTITACADFKTSVK